MRWYAKFINLFILNIICSIYPIDKDAEGSHSDIDLT